MNEVSTQSSSNGLMELLEKVILSPNSSVDMIDKIISAQERIMAKQAELNFNAGLAVMLAKIPVIAKTSDIKVTGRNNGPSFNIKYAALDEIVEVTRPILSDHGFSVNFIHAQESANIVTVRCYLRHKDGHHITNEIVLPVDTSGSKNAVQAVGSTISYGKRYTLCSILNIATGDDKDGFTVKAQDANQKQGLSHKRFQEAIIAVKNNTFPLDRIFSDYTLTSDQKAELNRVFILNGDTHEASK